MNRHADDILPVAVGRMDLNALNAAAKPSLGKPLVAIFIASNAGARFL
jgi:hypothetical protein